MPHESTIDHSSVENNLTNDVMKETKEPNTELRRPPHLDRTQSLVPHLYAETPQNVTHHHDTDDEESDHSDKS